MERGFNSVFIKWLPPYVNNARICVAWEVIFKSSRYLEGFIDWLAS
jgi:hypothetical protein